MLAKVKNGFILFFLFLLVGCSAIRKGKTAGSEALSAEAGYRAVLEDVALNNITDKGFEIRKGSIELKGTEIEGRFGLHARLNNKGDFYGSVRGPLGIELVRILMVENDIAVIDRFNRKIYMGKKDQVLNKNGMPSDFISIIFGDIPAERDLELIRSEKNEIIVASGNEEFRSVISICTDYRKICNQTIDANNSDHEIYMTFGEFNEAGGKKYPAVISVEERKKMFHVKLFIDDLIYGYEFDIDFNLPSYNRESF
jgi:hypothetical protein